MDGKGEKLQILVIDDDGLIRGLIRSLCAENAWLVEEAENGPLGIEMVRSGPDKFDLVLLDVMLPGPSGLEVLPELLKYGLDLAVIMMSGYAEVNSAVEAMQKGAYDFLQKPLELEVLVVRIKMALEQRNLRREHRLYVNDIEIKVSERTNDLEAARKATIFGLARLAEYRDEETGFHLERMASYVVVLARSMRQMGLYRDILTFNYLDLLFQSAPLHDIGKIGIPDAILRKPGKLTAEEYEIIKTHTVIGARAIKDIQAKVRGQTFLSIGLEVARSHHEWFNGGGYPDGLQGESIPLPARILALADYYDALSFPRIYRPFGFPHEEVVEMIRERINTQFDPDIVNNFLQCQKDFLSLRQTYNE